MSAPAAVQPSMSVRVRAVLPGALLALIIGAAALELHRFVPARLALPDVLIALLLGSLVINSPLAKWLRLGANDRGRNRYGVGLTFVGKTVLRVSVVLMGLRIEARLFESQQLLAIGLALLTAMPATFFVTHALAVPLRVSESFADLCRLRDHGLRRLGGQRRGAGHRRAAAGAGGRAGDDLPLQRGRPGAVSFLRGRGWALHGAGRDLERSGRERPRERRGARRADGPRGRRDGGGQQVGAGPDAGARADPVFALARRPRGGAASGRRGKDRGRPPAWVRARLPGPGRGSGRSATGSSGRSPRGAPRWPSIARSSPSRR